MADIKVSVIMPVYGVEDYVGKAIESIQAQTLTDWEFFCVDDGTKDRSGEICVPKRNFVKTRMRFLIKTCFTPRGTSFIYQAIFLKISSISRRRFGTTSPLI